ncbi:methyltransferase type 11 [Verrucomicrobia bacterium IMCC26134]|jgi:SAM-dependent methyltransferase|nr:methyltransferase type 11 [Verrucomicrobia bacterium IMCC26134]
MPDTRPLDYSADWDNYAITWRARHPDLAHLGDEWIGRAAGAATHLEAYVALIERHFIAPYVRPSHTVLEIGVGGGKTAALLLRHARHLIAADASQAMLDATSSRLGHERVTYTKLDGLTLDAIPPASADLCFCYDTLVHVDPPDIFNYLTRLPRLLKGDRLCILHHTNVCSELGWRKFLSDWPHKLNGHRSATSFSIMTPEIMERFLRHLGYEIIACDTDTIPRDCVWICRAPAVPSP